MLKAIQHLEHRPLVMMLSFDPNHDDRQICLKLGAAHYFDKATEFDQLIARCRQLAGERHGDAQGITNGS